MRSIPPDLDKDQSSATSTRDNLINRLSGIPAEESVVAKKESKSVNAIVPPKRDHRRAKVPAREFERVPASKRGEKRAQQHWAALVEEETLSIADYGNVV
jgi:hypothetical protein